MKTHTLDAQSTAELGRIAFSAQPLLPEGRDWGATESDRDNTTRDPVNSGAAREHDILETADITPAAREWRRSRTDYSPHLLQRTK